ncbi:uncharacterized protein LOC127291631 isoform X1 [Leptopilina boulardi]|uniref:uncharacterized protein LOC127291631 isoform X1 n=1 Tax=Leptopilina boulardi TaxID=63433 RepID=UPI0021F572D7|nr:uncharacterized protein LOC127291631 isoform X1 [Leptopilina boulardi]
MERVLVLSVILNHHLVSWQHLDNVLRTTPAPVRRRGRPSRELLAEVNVRLAQEREWERAQRIVGAITQDMSLVFQFLRLVSIFRINFVYEFEKKKKILCNKKNIFFFVFRSPNRLPGCFCGRCQLRVPILPEAVLHDVQRVSPEVVDLSPGPSNYILPSPGPSSSGADSVEEVEMDFKDEVIDVEMPWFEEVTVEECAGSSGETFNIREKDPLELCANDTFSYSDSD